MEKFFFIFFAADYMPAEVISHSDPLQLVYYPTN